MHKCINFILFLNDTLHVSDGISVHHQQFKTVHTATGICQTDTALCLRASRQQFDSLVHLVGFTIEIILRRTALWTSNMQLKLLNSYHCHAKLHVALLNCSQSHEHRNTEGRTSLMGVNETA